MKKIFVSILVCLMIVIPIQSVLGESKNLSNNNIEDRKNSVGLDVVELINQVEEITAYTYLEQFVSFGPRPTGSKNCSDAAEYIHNEFEKLGLNSYIDNWRFPRYKCQNVIATLNGTDPSSDAVFILCAHMDTTGNSPGANDDGAGVAALLTIANICSKYTFNHTIRFLVTSGEENGLYGSHDYARKMYEQNENIIAVLNLDAIGNNTEKGGNVVYLLKPERSNWISSFIVEIAQVYYEHINLTALPIANRGNDHQSFLNYGYDAVQFVQLARGNYPLHTPEDTIEKVNFTYLVKVIKLILATTIILADKSIDLQVRIVTPKEGYLYLFNQSILPQPKITLAGRKTRGLTFILGRTTARINITTDEEINSVAYCINGRASFPGFYQEGPFEWVIQISAKLIPTFRKYTFSVYVCTTSGKIAYDEMDLFVLTLH
ncbi:MAG: M28 family peptidase [Thermoplasmatales archaeon]|nr:MAG: M28 family peptidase [Thermoplasmatales archaeon]